jgi:septal ring-binding cell division protein DamX
MQKRANAAEVAAPIAVAQATPAPQKVQTVARMNDSDDYCIIVASVNNTDEANTYIAEAKQKYNEDCALLNIDGRYRIYIATAPSAAAAHTAIANGVAKRHPGAWVCARR